jgi:cytochrome c553
MVLVLMLAVCSVSGQATDHTSDIDIGRHIYRDGLLPNGEPLTALVAGDVPILGTQFSCESCHGRSGMGAGESTYIVPPIAGPFLFSESPQPKRPPYDLTSLARVLREGVTPSGRTLDRLMPRFRLSDDNIASLAAYLAVLSADNSPGVDDRVIRFGTIMTEDVDPAEREGVLAVLRQFFEEKNRQTRLDSGRWDRGYTPESRLPTVFREWHLDVWTLTGPAESWGEQLERYYAAAPVFALVSGLGTGDWEPVSRFCEKREIPCLFPGTDLPDAQAGDFYTLYFSRGLKLEADLIAAHLASHPASGVVQVFCDASAAGAAVASLRQTLEARGQSTNDLQFDCDKPLPTAELATRLAANPDSAAVLWLRPSQLTGLEIPLPASRIYVSSILLGNQAPDSLRAAPGPVFEAYAFKLPGETDPAFRRFAVWAKTRKIELTAPRRQAEAYFACMALGYTVKHMRRFFVRDYALDMLEHSQGLAIYLPYHPRPTFGPDQRFLNKGGYVLPVVNGKPKATNAEWLLP